MFFFFLQAILFFSVTAEEYVSQLRGDTFETFVSGTKNSANAVLFVSPWCDICKAIMPLWEEAAKLLSQVSDASSSLGEGGTINFGVIDAKAFPEIAEANGIQGFPTAKLYIDQEVFSYVHESPFTPISASLFVNWVNRHTKRRNVIENETQLSEFLKKIHLVAIGLFPKSDSSESSRTAFLHSSMHFEDVFFVEVVDKPDVFKAVSKIAGGRDITEFPCIVMVYDHDDKSAIFTGPFTQEAIDSFVKGRRLLTVNVFQPGTIEYILDAGLPMMFLVSPQEGTDDDMTKSFRSVAEKFLGKVVAVTVGTALPWEQKLCEVLDVHDIGSPVVRILNQPDSDHHSHDPVQQSQSIIRHGLKYRPTSDDGPLSVEKLTDFLNSFVKGTLKPYIRSEPEPEDFKDSFTPGSLLVNAVATNFDRLVTQDPKRDILVVYHAPWCGHCRKLMPTLRELGTKLAHAGKGLKIVKIDATRNEIPSVHISGYPTIVLYNAVDKPIPVNERKSIAYNGDRSLDDFVQFLRNHAVNSFSDSGVTGTEDLRYAFEEL
jgi:protein disulfide-isomerase A1